MPTTPDIYTITHPSTGNLLYILDRSAARPPVTTQLTIDRKFWARDWLAYPSGKSCALGHLCRHFGASLNDLLHRQSLAEILNPKVKSGLPFLLQPVGRSGCNGNGWVGDSDLAKAIWLVNDDKSLDAEVREELLIRLFEVAGVSLTFQGRYPRDLQT